MFASIRARASRARGRTRAAVAYDGSVKPADLRLRHTVRNGVPPDACAVAWDATQGVLAVATAHGGIAVLGRPPLELHMESPHCAGPALFVGFLQNEGALITVSPAATGAHIQLWSLSQRRVARSLRVSAAVDVTSAAISGAAGQHLLLGTASGCLLSVSIAAMDFGAFRLSAAAAGVRGAQECGPEGDGGPALVTVASSPVANATVLLAYASGDVVLWVGIISYPFVPHVPLTDSSLSLSISAFQFISTSTVFRN